MVPLEVSPLNLKIARFIIWVFFFLICLMFWIGTATRKIFFLFLGFALFAAWVIFGLIYYRCPHCGSLLYSIHGNYCPHCGRHLFED